MLKMTLHGPIRLGYDELEEHVSGVSPGVYMLGNMDFQSRFCLSSIGRFDADVRGGLRGLIGTAGHVMYRCASTSRAAFDAECELFHELQASGLSHPVRAVLTDWTCRYCRVRRYPA